MRESMSKWGIKQTVPSKQKGRTKESFMGDRTGVFIFHSQRAAKEYWNTLPEKDDVKVVKIRVTVTTV